MRLESFRKFIKANRSKFIICIALFIAFKFLEIKYRNYSGINETSKLKILSKIVTITGRKQLTFH